MKRAKLCAVAGVLGSLLVAGCATDAATKANKIIDAPYASNIDNQHADDQALKHKLQDSIDLQLKGSDILVQVYHYDVLLVGQTVNEDSKNQAVAIVKILPNVKKVFNYLTLSPLPALNTSSAISAQVMDRISLQKGINTKDLQVVTVDGVVYIMGSNIGNLTALNTAILGAYTIPSVNKVINLVRKGDQDYYANNFNN